jgi:hypothetical protein
VNVLEATTFFDSGGSHPLTDDGAGE